MPCPGFRTLPGGPGAGRPGTCEDYASPPAAPGSAADTSSSR